MSFNVLIVDDSKTVRSMIDKSLRLAKIPLNEVYHAGNGQEGLDCLDNAWVDIIFADINMPVMNGVEMIERIKAQDLVSKVPIVVISTEGSRTRLDYLEQCGIAAYLRKPFKPEQFSEIVHDVLGVSRDSDYQ